MTDPASARGRLRERLSGSLAQRLGGRLWQYRRLLAVIAVAEIVAIIIVSTISQHNHIDGEVYQLGAKAWLAGRDLYANLPPTETGLRLPFIYPPFAAIVFTPLALVPKGVAISIIMLLTHLSLLVALYVVLSTAPFLVRRRDHVVLLTAVALPVLTLSEPVQETIGYGQINVVLLVMVAVDCLWRTGGDRPLPYPRGLLIGLAAGIKLTPAAFLLFFLLRRDYRAIFVSVLTFLGTVLLGVALAFRQAGRFWTSEVFASGNMSFGQGFTGSTGVYAGNQSLRAVLTKLGLDEPWLSIVFAVLAVGVLALAIAGMSYALRQRDLPGAVMINAVAGLLLSPISWSHHWAMAVPALVLLWAAALIRQQWPLLLATSMAGACLYIAPHWKMPQGHGKELRWSFFQHLVGSSYVWLGVAFLLYTAWLWYSARRGARPEMGTAPEPSPLSRDTHPA